MELGFSAKFGELFCFVFASITPMCIKTTLDNFAIILSNVPSWQSKNFGGICAYRSEKEFWECCKKFWGTAKKHS